jgi:hypothetical protein
MTASLTGLGDTELNPTSNLAQNVELSDLLDGGGWLIVSRKSPVRPTHSAQNGTLKAHVPSE